MVIIGANGAHGGGLLCVQRQAIGAEGNVAAPVAGSDRLALQRDQPLALQRL